MTAEARWLRDRADSYWRDADQLRADDAPFSEVTAYRTIAHELRKCADEFDDPDLRV